MKLGYMRVSTDKQDNALQEDALNRAGCDKIYSDTISGKTFSRPAFDRMLNDAKEGDSILVWKIDRLGRSVVHVIQTADMLGKRGIDIVSLTEPVDTTTPIGDFVFNLMACLAQLERRIISERTKAGLAATRARGQRLGRPETAPTSKTDKIIALRNQGYSIRDIEKETKIPRSQVDRVIKKFGLQATKSLV